MGVGAAAPHTPIFSAFLNCEGGSRAVAGQWPE
ncbi:MAG: hypothetical protein MAG451_00566 [Anaerolineales bacterium]|nr:hypothetical protein [Anaerolineales bacterium]